MQRRKFIAGVGSLAAGAAAVTGTGAFTSVSANRDVTVNVASDSNALLGFKTDQSGPNSDYVLGNNSGTLSIDISGNNGNFAGSGINDDATTIIRDMFDIVNQGTQPVFVWQETNDDDGDDDAGDSGAPFGLFSDYPAWREPGAPQRESGPGGVTTGLGEGEKAQDALSSEEGLNLGSSIPARNYVEPGQRIREVGTFFFGEDISDINGEITLRAVDVDSFEGSVNIVSNPNRVVEVTDPTP
jgi:hypothetical protein